MSFTTRLACMEDAEAVLGVIQKEFSDSTLEVTRIILSTPGSIVTVAEKENGIIGVCELQFVADDLYAVCNYVVSRSERGRGVGGAVWNDAMARIPPDACVCLYGVEDMLDKYRRQGFTHDAYGVACYTGLPHRRDARREGREAGREDAREDNEMKDGDVKIVEYSEEILDKVIEYDKIVSGRKRTQFFTNFFKLCAKVFVAVVRDSVVGYTAVKVTGHSYGVMPLYADNEDTAHALMTSVLDATPEGAPLCVYVVDTPDARAFWEHYGIGGQHLKPDYKCRLLFNKQTDFQLSNKVFAGSNTGVEVV